ncbi:MAG TPA: DsbA family protein [Gemmatimonadota bacterium]|nr:DsbA family protein [Gemmatimonadota bacterium]
MDDPSLTDRRRGLGRTASLVVLGALGGLAIGWLAWRGAGGPDATPTGGEVTTGIDVVEGIDVSHDPVLGPDNAPITIVEFSDFECPFCSRFARETAPALRRQYGEQIRWIFVNYPLRSIHPNAYEAALAGECAADQGHFWPFYDAMFSGRHPLSGSGYVEAGDAIGLDEERFQTCYRNADHADEVALDIKEGEKFYILGTPTFYVNGKRMEGAQRPEAFAAVIDSILVLGS